MNIMTRTVLCGFSVFLLSVLPGCNWFSRDGKEHASCTHRLCDNVKTGAVAGKSFMVINVLDADLYDDAHIPGSVNVPYENFEQSIAQMLKKGEIDTNTQMVTYCTNYACTGSGEAARILKKLGFTTVKAYEAGMAEWYQLSQKDPLYIVSGPAKQKYLQKAVQKPAEKLYTDIDEISAEELKGLLCSIK